MARQSFQAEKRINKTKKPHRCFGCNKRFPAGRWLWYHAGVYDGEFYSSYMCEPCRTELYRNDYSDGFSQGDLKDARYQRAYEWRNKRAEKEAQ